MTARAALAVRFFGSLREAVGEEAMSVDFAGGGTVAALKARLRQRLPAAAAEAVFADGVQVAVNQVLAPDDAPIAPGDEVALLPPVTGG